MFTSPLGFAHQLFVPFGFSLRVWLAGNGHDVQKPLLILGSYFEQTLLGGGRFTYWGAYSSVVCDTEGGVQVRGEARRGQSLPCAGSAAVGSAAAPHQRVWADARDAGLANQLKMPCCIQQRSKDLVCWVRSSDPPGWLTAVSGKAGVRVEESHQYPSRKRHPILTKQYGLHRCQRKLQVELFISVKSFSSLELLCHLFPDCGFCFLKF